MGRKTILNKPGAMLGQPPAPDWFDKAERALWADVLASRPTATWTASDLLWLRRYVEANSDVDRLTVELAREGEVIGDKLNPKAKLRDSRERYMLSIAMRLKLMPANRWDPKAVFRIGEHANKARAATSLIDADDDDLLGGIPVGRVQ